MNHQSTIRAFQKILTTYKFSEPKSFPEDFAIKRYLKKMEIPDAKTSKNRKQKCFDEWAAFDSSLKLPSLLPGNWYKARLLIHQWCRNFRLAPVSFTNGSEAYSTFGYNSIESKLMRSKWECSRDCFDLWAETAYETLAIKRAVRARFSAFMKHDNLNIKAFHKESYKAFSDQKDFKFLCFKRALSRITFIRDSSRFSVVRKNNKKDRPIDVQPLCNMLVQRRVGNGFRDLLLGLGVDLNNLAAKHCQLIRGTVATIDLTNASDSVMNKLVEFCFPKRVYDFISRSRTPYTEGLDGHFYMTNKVSSMGNGFTFELMTVILRALGLQFSTSFSVFGDDIIIPNEHASSLIRDLEAVGFLINVDKTFINSPFRESCGGNYHDDFGYVESYDFEYPKTIHDCAVLNNKAYALSLKYPQFRDLYRLLFRAVPHALHGPAFVFDDDGRQGYDHPINLSRTFWSKQPKGFDWFDKKVSRVLKSLHYDPKSFKMIYGFKYVPKEASKLVSNIKMKRNTGKYFMYLHAGRKTSDIITGHGSWQDVAFLTDGKNLLRFKSLRDSELHPV